MVMFTKVRVPSTRGLSVTVTGDDASGPGVGVGVGVGASCLRMRSISLSPALQGWVGAVQVSVPPLSVASATISDSVVVPSSPMKSRAWPVTSTVQVRRDPAGPP